jgi:acetyltransferase-like isoleucine patch superfamily enzyme
MPMPMPEFWMHPRRQAWLADALFGGWRWASRWGTLGAGTRHARRFQAVGPGSAFAIPPGPTLGERWISIGDESMIGAGVALSAGMWPDEPLEPPNEWIVRIGDRCNLGRGSAVAGRVAIDIGDDVTTGPNVYVTDHNHRYADPEVPIARQWVDADPVRIGPGCWLGAGAVVLPGSTLGRNVVVAAGSVVRGDVPDNAVVAGVPGRVVRRRTADGQWDPPLEAATDADAPPPGW